jgi:Tol biopolymer transport system component
LRRIALVGMAAVIVSVVLASGVVTISGAAPGATKRVSVSSSGAQANDDSGQVSSNGRFVAFASNASNLVPRDTNNAQDIFVHDRQTGTTKRVSVSSSGAQGNHESFEPSITPGGGFVAFTSRASNLVPRDTNGEMDVFVHRL